MTIYYFSPDTDKFPFKTTSNIFLAECSLKKKLYCLAISFIYTSLDKQL